MPTYRELQNKNPPFDWWAFLDKGIWCHEELSNARELSGSWVTCACGEQCAIIPRDEDGIPLDDILRWLGCRFCGDISRMYAYKIEPLNYFGPEPMSVIVNMAKDTLTKIEERSQFLIDQINYNRPNKF